MTEQKPVLDYYDELVKMHVDKFGVKPVFTGRMPFIMPHEKIEQALKNGKPYVERPFEKGTVS